MRSFDDIPETESLVGKTVVHMEDVKRMLEFTIVEENESEIRLDNGRFAHKEDFIYLN